MKLMNIGLMAVFAFEHFTQNTFLSMSKYVVLVLRGSGSVNHACNVEKCAIERVKQCTVQWI